VTIGTCALAACTLFTDTDSFNSYVEPPIDEAGSPPPDATPANDAAQNDASSSADGAHALTAAEYRALVMSDGPAAYWRLADVAGTTAAEETGSYPGTIQGAPELGLPGPFLGDSKSMRFKGAELVRTDALSNSMTAAWSATTLEAWINSELAPGKEGKVIEWISTASSAELSFFIDDTSGALKGGVGNVDLATSTIVLAPAWHHAVFVVSSTTASIYVDGKLEATVAVPFPARPASGIFAIGADYDEGPDGTPSLDPAAWFKGRIAEVAVYDHVLTPERIAAHFAAR
jgi:large repetitive protein